MLRTRMYAGFVIALCTLAGSLVAQGHPGEGCTYNVLHNGPTWDADSMRIPHTVMAAAFARDGVYGGGGFSNGMGLKSGGAGVAVASVVYWFKVSHVALPTCKPVEFDSEADLGAEVSTQIHGDSDDYGLATGFQAISGIALAPASLAVAATNAGSPVSQSTLSVNFGVVGFSITIPGVSVTSDTVDRDRNSLRTSGKLKVEEEEIMVRCWTKTKIVTNGPFGGFASASIDSTHVRATTTSKCEVHGTTGFFDHDASEG